MATNAAKVIAKAQSYIGYAYNHFLDSFGIGCTAWCAAFVSVVGREAGGSDIIPWSISCNDQIKWFKDHDMWLGVTNDVRPGDYIYYDWDHIDEPKPADHVGIVESVNGNTFVVIEGNFGNAENWQTRVSRRTVTKGWGYIFGFARPKYDGAAATEKVTADSNPTLSKGDENDAVKTLQRLLIEKGYSCGYSGADGEFGAATEAAVKKFQADNGLTADGIVGPLTWAKVKAEVKKEETKTETVVEKQAETTTPSVIVVSTAVITCRRGDSTPSVEKMQRFLNGWGYDCDIDGEFGPATETAVKSFQASKNLTADGICGKDTWTKLING